MNTNEVKIGSLLRYRISDSYEWEYIPVFSIKHNLIEVGYSKSRLNTTAEPIPLTDEWLLKFGFEVNTPNLRWMHPVLLSEVYKTESGGLTLLQNGTHLTNNPILYVHQLQNLYFALTGEELTIK